MLSKQDLGELKMWCRIWQNCSAPSGKWILRHYLWFSLPGSCNLALHVHGHVLLTAPMPLQTSTPVCGRPLLDILHHRIPKRLYRGEDPSVQMREMHKAIVLALH